MIIEVTFQVEIDTDEATNEQIQEWLEFSTGACSDIQLTNPLCNQPLSADNLYF